MKRCFKCGLEKELTQFYKHKEMSDCHLNKCKECTKKDTSLNDKVFQIEQMKVMTRLKKV